jgi:hypothetical protein
MTNTTQVLKRNYDLARVNDAAFVKFGKVVLINDGPKYGEFIVMCERQNPVFVDKPFMTIKAYIYVENDKVEVAFQHGHYDLSREDAYADLNARTVR